MAHALVVTQAFGDFAKGSVIEDPELVAAVGASHPAHVVRVQGPVEIISAEDAPEPTQPRKRR